MGNLASPSAVAIIQARTGSTRLPGKVLETIGDRTVLEHVIARVREARINRIVIATTILPDDAAIMDVAREHNLPAYGGQVDDVLARFEACYRIFGDEAGTVVRVTADCPFLDPALLAQVANGVTELGFDYVGVKGAPAGTHQEAFTAGALHAAHLHAHDAYDREHVVPWIVRNRNVGWLTVQDDREPCTLDTPADLARLRRMAA